MSVVCLQTMNVQATASKEAGWVSIEETSRGNIKLDTEYKKPVLNPAEARELAKQLYRMARRVRMRSLPEEAT